MEDKLTGHPASYRTPSGSGPSSDGVSSSLPAVHASSAEIAPTDAPRHHCPPLPEPPPEAQEEDEEVDDAENEPLPPRLAITLGLL